MPLVHLCPSSSAFTTIEGSTVTVRLIDRLVARVERLTDAIFVGAPWFLLVVGFFLVVHILVAALR